MTDPTRYTVASIRLWGQSVGAVAESASGDVIFEYEPSFRASGLEISPIHLPLSLQGPQTFPSLRRLAAFEGLPGVLADAPPDAFGNSVIRAYFQRQGTPERALSPVQKLLYIGRRAVGALEFEPPIDVRASRASDEALEVAALVEQARRVIEGDVEVAVREMLLVGASAGGARAKALILWNRERNRVRSAFATPEPGDQQWLIKFDGVTEGRGGPAVKEDVRPGPFGRIEYAYSRMARAAGIEVPETHLLREREYAHFMVRRFDRGVDDPLSRIHLHSLGGLQHVDYNLRGAFSYEEYFRTLRLLQLGQPAVDEAFRRMTFNLAAANQDDHVKNFAFLMTREGKWHLSPAYDLTFAKGNAWTRTHQMTLNGKDDGFVRADLVDVGRTMDMPRGGADIIGQVNASLDQWEREAAEVEVPQRWVDHVRAQFRRF